MQPHINNSVDEDFINSLAFTLDEIEGNSTQDQNIQQVQPQDGHNQPLKQENHNAPAPHQGNENHNTQQHQKQGTTSHKIQRIKDQLELVGELSGSDEINWIRSQLATRKGEDFVGKIEDLGNELATIKQNQHKILSEMVKPINIDEMTSKGQIIHLLEQNEHMREEIRVLTGRIEELNVQVQSAHELAHELRKANHMLNETKAIGDSVESLRNTTYMLNKKMDMMNTHNKQQELENKMKEVVQYLHQLNSRIQSHFTQNTQVQKPQGDYISQMGFQ